jgi:hypothetical protein
VLELWEFGVSADVPCDLPREDEPSPERASLISGLRVLAGQRRAWKRAHRDVEARPAAPTPG